MALVLGSVSCGKRNLCCHQQEYEITVLHDWQKIFPESSIPEKMLLYVYPISGGSPSIFNLNSLSDKIKLPAGSYKILSINGDIKNAVLKNMDTFDGASVYVPSLSPSAKAPAYQYKTVPEMIHSATSTLIVKENASSMITMTPVPINHQVTVVTKMPAGGVISVSSAELSGLSASSNISTAKHSREDLGTHILPIAKTSDITFSGSIFTMGVCPDADGYDRVTKTLVLFVNENKGSYSITQDVSDIANTIQDNKLTIYTEITGSAEIGFKISITGYKAGDNEVIILKTSNQNN